MFISFNDIYSRLKQTKQTICLVCFWEGYNFGVQHSVSEMQTIKDIEI